MPSSTQAACIPQTNLRDESEEYLAKREELRLAELENMQQRERIAQMRRELPHGPVIEDYVFQEGPRDLSAGDSPVRNVKLSELFSGPDRSLIAYQRMFGKKQTKPCPMCTAMIDGINGIADHISQRADIVIVAAAGPAPLRAHARNRGWNRIRLLSCGDNTFKYDTRSENREGNQDSTISVFTLGPGGSPRHFYTAHPAFRKEINQRGIDLLMPIWNSST